MTASTPPVAAQSKTSGLAIAALVCGLGGLCTFGLGGIAGLILGIAAIVKVKRSGGQLKGKGLAIGGIIVGILSVLLWGVVVVGAVGLLLLQGGKRHEMCVSEMRERSYAESMARRAADHDLTQVSGAFEAFSDALKRRDCARLAELSRGESAAATEAGWREMLASPTNRVPGTSVLLSNLPEALSRSGGYSGSSLNDTAKYKAAGVTFHFKRQADGRWYFVGFE